MFKKEARFPLNIQPIDLVAGSLMIGIGLFVLAESITYRIGTARSMGPGYFPLLLGGLLTAFGLGILFLSKKDGKSKIDFIGLRGPIAVLGSIAAFAALVESVGLIGAIAAAVLISSFADPRLGWTRVAMLAVVLCILAPLLFIGVLGIRMELFRW